MIDVAKPQYLENAWMLWAFTGFAALLLLQQAWAHARWFDSKLQRKYGPSFSLWRSALKLGLWSAGMFFLLQALATPLGKPVKVKSEAVGADVILAVDVSSSMYAQDIKPNRLVALKEALKQLLGRLGGDRVGLVAFAGEAVVACPLTSDYDTAALFLDKLETDSVPRDGTGLGPALRTCLDKFSEPGKRGRIIILATDGEDNQASDAITQAKRAADLGIPVYTLGIGTPGGAYVPDRPDIFGRVMAKMYKGKPVRTKLDDKTLKKIASVTGGQYFAGASATAMGAAYERVRQLKQGKAKAKEKFVREPLYQKALFKAILLLLAEAMIANRAGGLTRIFALIFGWFRRKLNIRKKAVMGLLICAPLMTGFSLDPGREEYDLGNQAYREGRFEDAANLYRQSLEAKERPRTWYNLGNAHYRQGQWAEALESFGKAMELNPRDKDAAINYGLAQQMLEKQPQQQQQNQQDQKEQTKKQGQDKNKQSQKNQDGQQQQQSGSGEDGEQSMMDKMMDGLNPFGKNQDKNSKQSGQSQQSQSQNQNQDAQAAQAQPDKGKNKPGDQLSQEELHAIMNMLKNDQKKFSTHFEPIKKHKDQSQSQDPLQQMLQRMSGMKMPPKKKNGGNGDVKEW